MARRRSTRGLVAGGVLVLGACSTPAPGRECPKTRAAFHVVLTAEGGASLPSDTTLSVTYGGGSEQYALAAPPAHPAVVFCDSRPDAGTADAAAGEAKALDCLLWTQSAATVTVEASGYPTLEADLDPERDDCGITTVDYALVLGEADAG